MQKIEEFLKYSLKKEIIERFSLSYDKKSIETLTTKFIVYLIELRKWNKSYNLTSIEDEKEIIVKHFIDSLLYLCFIPEGSLKIADVGSGAGFPGMPIAIVRPELKVMLIEPSWKKCAFLKNLRRKLELNNTDIIQAKAEEVREKVDIVMSRALWSIKEFIKNCSHLLRENGYFLISKARKAEEELKELPTEVEVEMKEFILPEIHPFTNKLKRFIIKINNANIRY